MNWNQALFPSLHHRKEGWLRHQKISRSHRSRRSRALGVPKIWRFSTKRKSLFMYELRGGSYMEISASRSFPALTPEVLTGFIERSRKLGQTKAVEAFRHWLRSR